MSGLTSPIVETGLWEFISGSDRSLLFGQERLRGLYITRTVAGCIQNKYQKKLFLDVDVLKRKSLSAISKL